ncbi:MAG: YbjN domain-containing protein [Treponemataceae bacterium]
MPDKKIERYLIDLQLSYRELGSGMWLVEDEERGLEGIVVMHADSLVIVRVAVMKVPEDRRLELFTKLLELNAHDVLHGAYALEGDEIVLVDTLEYETMDLGDLQSALEAIGMALAQHYPILSAFLKR